MSLRNRFVLPIIFSSLAILGACGGGDFSHHSSTALGQLHERKLNGTYVFSITGGDSNFAFLTMVGTFTADGNGGISGGALDLNDPLVSAPGLGKSAHHGR